MQVFRPYLALNNAKEAIEYYKNVFDGEVLSIKYGDEIPGQEELRGAKDIVIHSEIKIMGELMFVSEAVPNSPDALYPPTIVGNNISLSIYFDNKAKQKEVYDNFKSSGATIKMELEEQYWGEIFAIVQDKYGITWLLSYQV